MPERVRTDEAPLFESFDLPISQAVIHDDTVYVSGQAGIDPETGNVVEGGVAAETRQALANIDAILAAAGTSLDEVLKATLFVADMDDFETVNEVYEEFVSEPYPARSAIEANDLALDFAIEVEVTAAL